jgi:hypothetical protein
MVMQVEHREFILVRAENALRPVRSMICIALHPKVLVVGVYKQVAREGLIPSLGFVVDRALVATLGVSVVVVGV